MKFDLLSGENIIMRSPGTIQSPPNRHDGTLILTNKRLHFDGLDGYGWVYSLDQILEIKINNVLFFLSEGILLTIVSGKSEVILVHQREEWVAKIMKARAYYVSTGKSDELSAKSSETLSPSVRSKLRMALEKHYNEEELRNLCFDLNVEYENLEGSTKQAKIRELILYSERKENLKDLIEICKSQRPLENWNLY